MSSFVYIGSAELTLRSSCFATTGDAFASRAGNQGFLAIGDWLKSYSEELKELFKVNRIPSYSTIRRALLGLDYEDYSARLANFAEIIILQQCERECAQCLCFAKVRCVSIAETNLSYIKPFKNSLQNTIVSTTFAKVRETEFRQSSLKGYRYAYRRRRSAAFAAVKNRKTSG